LRLVGLGRRRADPRDPAGRWADWIDLTDGPLGTTVDDVRVLLGVLSGEIPPVPLSPRASSCWNDGSPRTAPPEVAGLFADAVAALEGARSRPEPATDDLFDGANMEAVWRCWQGRAPGHARRADGLAEEGACIPGRRPRGLGRRGGDRRLAARRRRAAISDVPGRTGDVVLTMCADAM
jgi:hypothetical protein